jgi:hypothetical protein
MAGADIDHIQVELELNFRDESMGPKYFVFCCLYPSSSPATAVVLLYHECRLAYPMTGEVSWKPKRERIEY